MWALAYGPNEYMSSNTCGLTNRLMLFSVWLVFYMLSYLSGLLLNDLPFQFVVLIIDLGDIFQIVLSFLWWCIISIPSIFSCDQEHLCQSARLSASLSVTPFHHVPPSYHDKFFRSYYNSQKWCLCKKSGSEVKGQGHRDQNKFCHNLGASWL